MDIAIALFKKFTSETVKTDFFHILEEAHSRGHRITFYVSEWNTPLPPYVTLKKLPVNGLTELGKIRNFFETLQRETKKNPPDVLLGFTRGPGLDVYFAGDSCFTLRERKAGHFPIYHLFSKQYTVYSQLEHDVFSPESRTEILYLTERQKEQFTSCFRTPSSRFHLLPPGMSPDCKCPENAAALRKDKRDKLGLKDTDILILQSASNLYAKGADRLLEAMFMLPPDLRDSAKAIFLGNDQGGKVHHLAEQLNMLPNVKILPVKEDLQEYLIAADLLVHLPRGEEAGVILIEAIASGLPVLCTENCGYRRFVSEARAGCILSGKFDQLELNLTLQCILKYPEQLKILSRYALEYSKTADFYSRSKAVIDYLEDYCRVHRR